MKYNFIYHSVYYKAKKIFIVLLNIFRSKHDELFEEFESTRESDILQPDVLQQVTILLQIYFPPKKILMIQVFA